MTDREFRVTFGRQYPREDHPTFPAADQNGWVTVIARNEVAATAAIRHHLGEHWSNVYEMDERAASNPAWRMFPLGELGRIVNDVPDWTVDVPDVHDAVVDEDVTDTPAQQLDLNRRGLSFTRDQLEAWAGRTLTDEEVAELEDNAPNSSIPEAFAVMAANLETEHEAQPPPDIPGDEPVFCTVCQKRIWLTSSAAWHGPHWADLGTATAPVFEWTHHYVVGKASA